MSHRRRAVVALLAVTSLAVGLAAAGWALIGDGGVIKTCVSQATGTWRPIEQSASCKKGETTLELYSRAGVDALVGALDTRVDDLESATGGGLTTASRRWQLLTTNQRGDPLVVGDYTVTPVCQPFGGLSFAVDRDSTLVGSAFYELGQQSGSGTHVLVIPNGRVWDDTVAPLTLTVDVQLVGGSCAIVAVGQVAGPA